MRSAQLDKRDRARIREIADELATLRLQDTSGLLPSLRALRDVVELESVGVYSVRNRTGAWRVDRWDAIGLMADAGPPVRKLLQDEVDFPLYYNPLAPAVHHQNRVVDALAWIERRAPGTWERNPMCVKVLRHRNAHRWSQPRALIWNGTLLLGWFGGMDPSPPTPRQMMILSMLVTPMRRRLAAEESLRETPYLRAALDVALARIGSPAFVVSSRGTIRESNDAGRALLARDSTVMTSLREAVAGRRTAMSIEVIPMGCAAPLWLAIVTPASRDARIAACVEACTTRWALTRRQRQVLALIVQGLSNAAIAAELQCVERTVELHVTALLDRFDVDNRSALVAKVLTTLS
jgi:DNA-binding NarL/FixJ family response regulator